MQRIVLVRHGESALNAASRQKRLLCGQFETPLTPLGREQARRVGAELAGRPDLKISHAVSSSLDRAAETLKHILQQLTHRPEMLPASAAFNERSLGIFEGRFEEDVLREFPQYESDPRFCRFREDFEQKAPGGENLTDVTNRAWPELERHLQATTDDLLIVSHYNTIRCLIARALQLSQTETLQLRISHTIPVVLVYDGSFDLEPTTD